MALLFTTPLFYPTYSSSTTSAPVAHPSSSVWFWLVVLLQIIYNKKNGIFVSSVWAITSSLSIQNHLLDIRFEYLVSKSRGALIVKASSDVDGTGASAPYASTPSDTNKTVPVANLPSESKIQMNLQQKMKMKIAKKIRLRRKRLLRKRHLRKMGRWPPSKLKKNKNV